MDNFFVLAAHNTLFALVLALFAYGLTRIWRNPPVAHVLWLLVLIKLVAPPVMHFDWSGLRLPESTYLHDQAITDRPPAEGQRDGIVVQPTAHATADASATTVMKHDFAGSIESFWIRARPVFVWFWLGGIAVCALVAATRIVRFERMLRDTLPTSDRLQRLTLDIADKFGIRRVPDVRYAECVEVPLLWCLGRRPTVVLPLRLVSQLEDQQIALILTHELAHLRRRDHWVRGVELIVSTVYWWNPLVRVIRRQLHQAEDLCCDAWVRWSFPDCQQSYAEVVLKTAESLSASQVSARLLPASPFLRSLSLKARIEMILESRFAPQISRRAMFLTTLMASLVLPSFVQMTATSAADESPATTSVFPYQVQFEQGATKFKDGDRITILEVRGTAETFTPGDIYWIRGTYTLASQDKATLAAYTTAKNAADGRSRSWKFQKSVVDEGKDTFTLLLPMSCEGWPHVSFYPHGGGSGFGGNYFGTGDSVLKQWWGSEEKSASQTPEYLKGPGHTTYIVGHWDQVGWEILQKQSPYKHQNLYGRWPMTDVYKKALRNDAKPGDTVLVLLSLDESHSRRVPDEFSDLLLLPWSEIESRLKQGQIVFKKGKARDMNVFLLATPTSEGMRKEFRRLVAEGKYTSDK